MAPEPSFRKINYLLRPTKQVERRLIVEALARLAPEYDVSTYRYLGFGSIYYADFLMFHRFLRMADMWCVEKESVPLAMEFNRPFEFVRVFIGSVATVTPLIDRTRPHVVWLDFDGGLNDDALRDIDEMLSILAPGSIFVASVQARPPEPQLQFETPICYDARMAASAAAWDSTVRAYRRKRVRATDLTVRGLCRIYQAVLSKKIRSELYNRPGGPLSFYQLFSFRYRDGVPMFTIGGIVDRPRRARAIARTGVTNLEFVRVDPKTEPVEISVPMLTLREKAWLEKNLSTSPETAGAFELDAQPIENFRRYYRYYPTYNEVLF